ncbi:MAG: response regulator transcription factor [Aureliella sp.]
MKLKVLVAEDDTHTRSGLVELLQEEDHLVFAAPDGLAAWAMYQQKKPDIVCLDVMMPGMSGYDVCRKIRSAGFDTPVLFITAKGQEIDKVVGLELGADDYIVKPFGVREFVARIRAIARRCLTPRHTSPGQLEDEFWMDDLLVLPRQMRCRRADVTIDLSAREIKILATLFSNAGEVVSRQCLMNEAWGEEYMPSSRTLDQHISQLRKRVELDPKSPRIVQTVHGAGYRYQPQSSSEQ